MPTDERKSRLLTVYLALKDLPKGTVVDESSVKPVMESFFVRPDGNTDSPDVPKQVLGRRLNFNVYRDQRITEMDFGPCVLTDLGIRCLEVTKTIPAGGSISRDNVKTSWMEIGKGAPDPPFPELVDVVGQSVRGKMTEGSVLMENDIRTYVDPKTGKSHGHGCVEMPKRYPAMVIYND